MLVYCPVFFLVLHSSLTLCHLHSLKAQIYDHSNTQLLANPVHCPLSLGSPPPPLHPSSTLCIISVSPISCTLSKGEVTPLAAPQDHPTDATAKYSKTSMCLADIKTTNSARPGKNPEKVTARQSHPPSLLTSISQ
jgi:hypothetical protein